jgi:translation elongation factor EF-G
VVSIFWVRRWSLRRRKYVPSGKPAISSKSLLLVPSPLALKIAGAIAFRDAAKKANPVLLEPVMAVEVTVPEEHMGTIIGDINSRRGRIEGMEYTGGSQVIKAIVPLMEMFEFDNYVRSSTQGRAFYSMQFARYEQLQVIYDKSMKHLQR